MTNGCELCEAAVLTTRYYDDDACWIADCEVCRVPMVVWRVHDAAPPRTCAPASWSVSRPSPTPGSAWAPGGSTT